MIPGAYEKPPEPMNTVSAIEAMKILSRYASDISGQAWGSRAALTALLRAIKETNPPDALILVALMYGKKLREVKEDLKDLKGGEFAVILSNGFIVNSLPELVNTGYHLGLMDTRWERA